MTGPDEPTRLRGTTLLAGPLGVIAVIGLVMAVATVIWGTWEDHEPGAAFWITLGVTAGLGVAALVAIRGCFVRVEADTVSDVVAWITVWSVARHSIQTARVAAGPWRWYVLEMADGNRRTLVGASPQQWPARLLPEAKERDISDLDLLLGAD